MEGYSRVPTRQDTDVVGKRIGAAIIDTIIGWVLLFLVTAVLGSAGAAMGEGGGGGAFVVSFFVLPFVVFVAYFLLLEGLWDGYTIGKKVLSIKVVKENGQPIGIGDSVLRNLLRFIDGLFYYLVGFIFIATSDRKQRLGDRIASTVVVTDAPAAQGGPAYQQQGQPRGQQGQYQGGQPQQGYQGGQPQQGAQAQGGQPRQGHQQGGQQPHGQPQGGQPQGGQGGHPQQGQGQGHPQQGGGQGRNQRDQRNQNDQRRGGR